MNDEEKLRLPPSSPVTAGGDDDDRRGPGPGIALCLSGGGYRSMLFALGSLMRLNELGVLRKVSRISSVSGSSITAALLGLKWRRLAFDADGVAANFNAEIVAPVRDMASTTIDVASVLVGLLPGTSINDRVIAQYTKRLYGHATLQDLPADGEGPRFVLNATNVQTGALWRFSRPYMGDYQVGRVLNPTTRLAVAVAASTAFPPVLAPAVLQLRPGEIAPDKTASLQRLPYTTRVVLVDGGIYDNLGLETAWKRYQTILVCDAGAKMAPQEWPKEDWARLSYRVLDVIDNQVRSLRKRQVLDSFLQKQRDGAYWGIRTDIADYKLSTALPAPHARTMDLAATPTRLAELHPERQERLINWGYAVCDAALRKHAKKHISGTPAAAALPYPRSGI